MKGKKYFRVLYMYDQMKAGKVVVTTDAINMFDVDRRTIQRDLNEIRCYLADRKVLDGTVKVNKPQALCNMSDIAFAIDMYLTGDEGVDLIEVLSVDMD